MSKKVTTFSRKGQITIPKQIRDELGLSPGDSIEITPDGEGGARLRRGLSLGEVMGIFPANGLTLEEIMERADEDRAEYYLQKHRRIFGKDFLVKKDWRRLRLTTDQAGNPVETAIIGVDQAIAAQRSLDDDAIDELRLVAR